MCGGGNKSLNKERIDMDNKKPIIVPGSKEHEALQFVKRYQHPEKFVLIPKEVAGKLQTSDGTKYYRDENGCLRRVK